MNTAAEFWFLAYLCSQLISGEIVKCEAFIKAETLSGSYLIAMPTVSFFPKYTYSEHAD